jgi:hypothetical protein
VDIIKEFIDLAYLRSENRRAMFDKTCKPLYEKMELITKYYYAMLHKVAADLEPDNVSAVLKNLEAERSNLVIARDGSSGAASAFRRHCARHHPKKLAERSFLSLSINFTDSIISHFWKSYYTLEDEGLFSMATGIIARLRYLEHTKKHGRQQKDGFSDVNAETIRQEVISCINNLEENWTEVSRRYAELKLFCGA